MYILISASFFFFCYEGEKRMRERSIMNWDGGVGERTEKERTERHILIEGLILRLARKLTLGKFPGIHMDPS